MRFLKKLPSERICIENKIFENFKNCLFRSREHKIRTNVLSGSKKWNKIETAHFGALNASKNISSNMFQPAKIGFSDQTPINKCKH